jgi:hypothetical protein
LDEHRAIIRKEVDVVTESMGESDGLVWVKGRGRMNDAPAIGDFGCTDGKRVEGDINMAVMWREREDGMSNGFEGVVVSVGASVDLVVFS